MFFRIRYKKHLLATSQLHDLFKIINIVPLCEGKWKCNSFSDYYVHNYCMNKYTVVQNRPILPRFTVPDDEVKWRKRAVG